MEWYDKLLRDLEKEENVPIKTLKECIAQFPSTGHGFVLPENILLGAIAHDDIVMGAMKRVTEESEGALYEYIATRLGNEEASYLTFQVATLVELVLTRKITTTEMLKALHRSKNRVEDKGKEEGREFPDTGN